MSTSTQHRWQFHRQGGFDQVVLKSADDLRALPDLDQKLWVALACPVDGLALDTATLSLLDADADGRIRAPEVQAAVRWMADIIKDLGQLSTRPEVLPLDQIRTDTAAGKAVHESARGILADLGRPDAVAIAPADTADTQKIFAATRFNGDGVITAESAAGRPDTEALAAVIADIITCLGSDTDRSGKPGVSQARVTEFFAEVRACAAWWQAGDANAVQSLGGGTAAAAAAFAAVQAKIEDWFTRGRLAAFDARAAEHLARPAAEWVGIAERTLNSGDAAVAAFPLAQVVPGQPLPLTAGLNPAWAAPMAAFRQQVVVPLLGERASLTAEQFADLVQRFAAYAAWQQDPKGVRVAGLGAERVAALLAGDAESALTHLIAQDEARRPEAEGIAAVGKATLLYRDLHTFLSNFVTFADFYDRRKRSAFVSGTLYLDGRACDLVLPVTHTAAHSAVAGLSNAYLAYCDCTRKGSAEKRTIVAAFTNGDSDFLRVGRNGLFYDRAGNDWDATIVKVVEAPISVRQAFFTPYKRIARFVGDQVEKFAAAREKQVEADSAAKVAAGATAATAPKPAAPAVAPAPAAPPAPAPGAPAAPAPAAPAPAAPAGSTGFDIARFAGIFAAIGLALGAIGSAIALVLTGFLGLALWQMPLAIAGTLMLISGPSMLMAWLKLRQRNLGPLLDAGGWAINTRARINVPFGATLTRVAALPEGARRELSDPYAEPPPKWKKWAALAAALVALSLLWELGLLSRWFDL